TTRRPLTRKRNASFTPEVLELFIELEHAPKRGRGDAFNANEKKLMYALGLVAEFWTMTSVLDRSTEPGCEPQYGRYKDWHTCKRLRERLLATTESANAPSSVQ